MTSNNTGKEIHMILNKESIINAVDIKAIEVDVPEWGGNVLVKPLSVGDRDEFTAWVTDNEGKINARDFMTKLVLISLVDKSSNRLFTNDELSVLSKKSAKVIERLFKQIQEVSGLGEEALQEAKKTLKNKK